METIENIFSKHFELSKLDIGKFAKMKVGPMKFNIVCYDVKGIGRLSILKGKAMFGLMKTNAMMLTVFTKDVPLFSYDTIEVMKNETVIIECYDTLKEKTDYPSLQAIKEKLKDVPVYRTKPAWYDPIRLSVSAANKSKKDKALLDETVEAYLNEFCKIINEAKNIDPEEKKALQAVYVNGLLEHGGASTDAFVKNIGKEKTEELYRKYLFGIE